MVGLALLGFALCSVTGILSFSHFLWSLFRVGYGVYLGWLAYPYMLSISACGRSKPLPCLGYRVSSVGAGGVLGVLFRVGWWTAIGVVVECLYLILGEYFVVYALFFGCWMRYFVIGLCYFSC